MKLLLVLLAIMAVIAVAEIQFEDNRDFNSRALADNSDNFEIDAAMFDRWPRNIKRFTNKWQQLGPIWG